MQVVSDETVEPQLEKEDDNCYHCGDPCGSDVIHAHEKNFCCSGCKSVFEILNEHNMSDGYYSIESNPGIRQVEDVEDKFAYLENKEIIQKLIAFENEKFSIINLNIPQVHCSSCVWLLEHLHKLNQCVLHSEVNFIKRTAVVHFDRKELSLRKLVELLASLGYEPDISLASEEAQTKRRAPFSRKLLYKIGVAGFCFGNIMLFSFPEYLVAQANFLGGFKHFFSYLNLLLSVPVLLYCAFDYFRQAVNGLRNKQININVPIAIGIVAIFGRSVYEIAASVGPGYLDSLAGLVFFLLIGKWFQSKTYEALTFDRDFKSYFPLAVIRFEGKREEHVPIAEIKVDDRIKVRNREIIPADSKLLSEEALIDYSFVTGEAELVRVKKGELVYAGGKQEGSSIELLVVKEVSQGHLTQLWNKDVFNKNPSLISELVNKASKHFTIAILSISLGTLVYWWLVDTTVLWQAVTAVLIVACPCALALSLPFTMGNAIRILGKKGFYARNASSIETLSKVDVIVFDKTGTLTESKKGNLKVFGKFSATELQAIKSVVQHSTHPLSQALFNGINEKSFDVSSFKEIEGKGVFGVVKIDEVNYRVKVGSPDFVGCVAHKEGLSTTVFVNINEEVKGYFEIQKELRSGVEDVLSELLRNHNLVLLSGDKGLGNDRLEKYFSAGHMLFNQSPLDKLEFIKQLQSDGRKVLMIGDGLNDAGALKQSDVGIAISDNINTFSPACDAILDAKVFKQLHNIIAYSKTCVNIVRASIVISILYNVIGVTLAVQGLLTPLIAAILMPLSSITVVAFVTVMSNLLDNLKAK